MARSASNRDRIQKLALEAELTAKEKSEKPKKKKKKTTKKSSTTAAKTRAPSKARAAAGGRVKLVWKVFDPAHKEIATFPYPQKEAAEAKASQRSDSTGKVFVVRGVKVPMDED